VFVCLSHAGVVPKWLNEIAKKHHMTAHGLYSVVAFYVFTGRSFILNVLSVVADHVFYLSCYAVQATTLKQQQMANFVHKI